MPTGAKRYYLCNLIPLWKIDEEDMEVDWPRYHAFFGDLVAMRADITKRRIRLGSTDGEVTDPDLRIRFEIYESDFLLSGGLNDHMATFSSHADFGDDPTVRPMRIVDDFDAIPESEREQFIYLRWIGAHETTVTVTAPDGTDTTRDESVPDTLEVRCWWRVEEEEGGDVSGNPEYYYDIFVEGKLEDDSDLELEERSDHELEGMRWNVTDKPRRGRVTPLVDGEYAFLHMLRMMDEAQHTIHILNWKMDPYANLLIEPDGLPEYGALAGMTPAEFDALLVRCKPRPLGVSARNGIFFYTASNGNVIAGPSDGTSLAVAVQQIDDPTNLDHPVAVQQVGPPGAVTALVLDQLRSRLLLYVVLPKAGLHAISEEAGLYAAAVSATRAFPVYQLRPTLPAVMANPGLVAGFIPLVGDGNPGYADQGLATVNSVFQTPAGKLNRPGDFVAAAGRLFIADTGNHCIRRVDDFDATDLDAVLASASMTLRTLAGTPTAGDADGAAGVARFRSPSAIAWDSASSRLLVADTGNRKIRAVNPGTGAVTTLSLIGIDDRPFDMGEARGLAFNASAGAKGTLYVSLRDRNHIVAVDLDTLRASVLTGSLTREAGRVDGALGAARFHAPIGLAYDPDIDTLLVADSENHVLRAIELGPGTVRTIGSSTTHGVHDVPVALADVLTRKAAEGVNVRILIDGYGASFARDTPPITRSIGISGEQNASDLHFLHPRISAFVQNHVQTVGGRQLASYHEKMMVVDGRLGTVGGIDYDDDKNDGVVHDRNHRNSLFWHDVVAQVEGKAALGLEEAFVRRWSMAREELATAEGLPLQPEAISEVDRTDAGIQDDEAEMVRTFDPTPLLGFLVNLNLDGSTEILESYRRAIMTAEHYVYMEHQYIYYPEIGEYLEDAMKENKGLQVIWGVPFFTEEAQDPTQERARLVAEDRLASHIGDASQLLQGNQLRSQVAWHGFFRHREMVDTLRGVDRNRFGVFSFRRIVRGTSDVRSEMIYPHSKMILCDDRFFSIGSANANGRGFTKDGELNVASRSPRAGRELRDRLWGEHLGFLGVAAVQADGSLFMVNGHHLRPTDAVRLRHPSFGEQDRQVSLVDPATGLVSLDGAPLDPALGRVFWRDPRLDAMRLSESMAFWRLFSHSLSDFRKVQGSHARTDASGALVVNGHLARPGDKVVFGQRLMLLNEEGRSAGSNPVPRPLIGGELPVSAVTANTISFGTIEVEQPDQEPLRSMAIGDEGTVEPFRYRIAGRAGGVVRLEILGLMPNLPDVPFNYHVSYLMRQPGGRKWVRTWEVDPPEGIEYAGPGSVLFSPWWVLPWFFIDFDPDEQARLDRPGAEVAIA